MNFFKILRLLQYGDKDFFDIPIAKQLSFLDSLGEPKNDVDRGYKQYLCQNFFVSKWKILAFNIAAAFLVPFVVLLFLAKRCFVTTGCQINTIIENKGMEEVIPTIVKDKYRPDNRFWREGASMSLKDLGMLLKLVFRAPHHPYFVLKGMMNVVYYSDMIRRHNPKVIIQFGEFSFSSSILTTYCHSCGVKHIDIMHGEKLLFIRDAFFHYDECYVWNEHYVELFREMKAEYTQFRVALPASMHIHVEKYKNPAVYADYKYYLAIFSEEQLKGIVQSMGFAKKRGKTVKYRPHPRYSDMEILRKYVKEEEIEYPREVGIMESISNLDYAVGSFTTVLSQAYFSGKRILLDDITFKYQYDKLKELKYILSSSNSLLLSDCQLL